MKPAAMKPATRALLLAAIAVIGCGESGLKGQATPSADASAADTLRDVAAADAGTSRDLPAADRPASTCEDDRDCGGGQRCWLGLSSARSCVSFTVPEPAEASGADSCDLGPVPGERRPLDCCNHDRQCTERPRGLCQLQTSCGGAAPLRTFAACQYDAWCTEDAHCRNGAICVPASLLGGGPPQCLQGVCRTSADCTRHPGGECVVDVPQTCDRRFRSLYCRYPADVCFVGKFAAGCQIDGGARMYECIPAADGHGTRCVPDPGLPP